MSDGPVVNLPVPALAAPLAFMPVMSLVQAKQRRDQFVQFVQECLTEDLDFGKVPGSDRPALLKPGAEKLCTLFGLQPTFELIERVEDWTGKDYGGTPFFYYFYKCRLWRDGTFTQGEGDGSCNSFESKYRYRWVPKHELPRGLDPAGCKTRGGVRSEFDFAIEKAETTGQYGKPADYWKQFSDAIESRTARSVQKQTSKGKLLPAWEIDSTLFRVPNEDAADQVNTIQKMAQKRALVAATLIAVNASDFFTQDIEEMETSGPTPAAEPTTRPAPPQKQEAAQGDSPDALRLKASRLFQDVCKICDPEHPKDFSVKLTAHLEKYLGDDLHKISTEDPYSVLVKLQQVWDRENQQSGAGKLWVEQTAAAHQKREPGEEPPPAKSSKKKPADKNGKSPLGELYAKVGLKAGPKDGMTLLNLYITERLGVPVVEMLLLKESTEQYKKCFQALAMLADMGTEEIRQVLVPREDADLQFAEGIDDRDVPF